MKKLDNKTTSLLHRQLGNQTTRQLDNFTTRQLHNLTTRQLDKARIQEN